MSVAGMESGRVLEWRENGILSRRSTLSEAGRAIGGMRVLGIFGHRAEFDCGGRIWMLQRPSFWSREVVAEPNDSREPTARFAGGWLGKGTAFLSNDRELIWKRLRPLGWRWGFSAGEDAVMVFQPVFSPLRARVRIAVERAGNRLSETDVMLLAALGWHALLSRRHSRHG